MWQDLKAQRADLFPNLKTLHLNATNVSPFLSSSLRRIEFGLSTYVQASVEDFSTSCHLCPDLVDLRVNVSRLDDLAQAETNVKLYGIFQKCNDLRRVHVYGQHPPDRIFPALCMLPSLQHLYLASGIRRRWTSPLALPAAIPSLRSLTIECAKASANFSLTPLINSIGSGLRDFGLGLKNSLSNETPMSLKELTKALSRHPALRSVTVFGLQVENLTADAIAPLRCCTALEQINIQVGAMLDLTDIAVLGFIDHLPRLRSLTLITSREAQRGPRCLRMPTIMVLSGILQACPSIEVIKLAVNARNIDFEETQKRSKSPSLQHLGLVDSWVGDPLPVAKYIKSLFGTARPSFYGRNQFHPEEDALWHLVDNLVHAACK